MNFLDDPRIQSAVSDAEEKINGKLVQNGKPGVAPTDAIPVKTFVSTSTTDLAWNETAITGGWKTAAGKRVFFLAQVTQGETTNHVNMSVILAKILEVDGEAGSQLGLDKLYTDDQKTFTAQKLTAKQCTAIREALTNSGGGAKILDESNSELNDGQSSEMASLNKLKTTSGEAYTVGWAVDFIPTITKDGKSVHLVMVAQLNDPLQVQAAVAR